MIQPTPMKKNTFIGDSPQKQQQNKTNLQLEGFFHFFLKQNSDSSISHSDHLLFTHPPHLPAIALGSRCFMRAFFQKAPLKFESKALQQFLFQPLQEKVVIGNAWHMKNAR